ncbi:MAG: four helix bundle protein [Bacteroidales bacterium]|nr:four helix bundle protein [Bacteroidales bacterium]
MKTSDENLIATKSKAFAIRCINLYKYLTDNKKEFVMVKQLLRSGTSIGANIKEAIRGQSKADFGAKMNIALKESSESEYWLELLYETKFIKENEAESMLSDCRELIKLLISIVKTTFGNKEI